MTTESILAILQMAIQYGIPAVTAAINALGKDAITDQDIEELKGLVKPPESY